MIKISFIVPIFNMEKYLRRCLESIQRQSNGDFEVILVDDGSTDSSANICKEFVKSDKRFTYHYQKNAWLSAARNTGISLANGEYISFVDSDDYIEEDFVLTLYSYARETQADIICFGFKKNILGSEKFLIEFPESKVVQISTENILTHFCRDWLHPQRMNYSCTKIYRRGFINKVGILFNKNALYIEDRNFNYKVFFHSKCTAYLSEALYFYYQHEDSISHSVALTNNLFKHYLYTYQDVINYWESVSFRTLDPIKPIAFLRTMQGALYNTMQTVNNLEIMADAALQAFEEYQLSQFLEFDKLYDAIYVYSDICKLSWGEQSKIWLFALSLLGGNEGIIAWQKLYPYYCELLIQE